MSPKVRKLSAHYSAMLDESEHTASAAGAAPHLGHFLDDLLCALLISRGRSPFFREIPCFLRFFETVVLMLFEAVSRRS